jgi:hypothetical protein
MNPEEYAKKQLDALSHYDQRFRRAGTIAIFAGEEDT